MKMRAIDRRLFLKGFLAASGALAGTRVGKARAEALKDVTVVVVGAGCAGLGAAASLRKQGANVVVLEARDRIGGRLLTDWSMGAPFEVGAGWIHGPSPDNPSKQLADAVGAEYVVTDDENAVTLSADGEQWSDERLTEVSEYYFEILDGLWDEIEVWDDRSFLEAINDVYPGALSDPDMLWAFSAYLEFSAGAPIEDLSAPTFLRTDVFEGADVVVTTGYDEMLKPLAEGLDIRLETEVTAIRYSDEGVSVETSEGTFEGDFCICSVPLGVLKAEKIAFDPELPGDHRDAIEELGFNSVTKIAFKFEEPFWDIETQYFGIATEEKGRWNYWLSYRTFSDENIILGVSVGAYAPVADAMSDEEIAEDALDVLRNVWGEEEVGEPTQMLRTAWKEDSYALGAYAYPRPGVTGSVFNDLADPVEDRLIFCGEHTFFDHIGTTHGAYMSGIRAAEQVVDEAT